MNSLAGDQVEKMSSNGKCNIRVRGFICLCDYTSFKISYSSVPIQLYTLLLFVGVPSRLMGA